MAGATRRPPGGAVNESGRGLSPTGQTVVYECGQRRSIRVRIILGVAMSGRGNTVPSGFGEKLRELREHAGLTQAALGEKAGTAANTIARLERGEHEPTWPMVLKLAQALGVDCKAFAPAETRADPPPDLPTGKHK